MRWTLLLAALAGVWLHGQVTSPVARVRELPANVRFSETLIDGWVYGVRSSGLNGGALAVGAFQLDAPRQREVLTVTVGSGGASVTTLPMINREGVFYAVEDSPPAARVPVRQPSLSPDSRVWMRAPRLRLWRSPLSGAAPKELLTDIRTSAVSFGERHIYWLRSPLTGPGAPLARSGETIPAAELMASSVEGGAARKLATVQVDSRFTACDDGVRWSVRKGSEAKHVHLRIEDGAVDEIPAASPPEQMVELGGSWYWLERDSEAGRACRRLVMAGPDSPRRVLIALEDRAALEHLVTDGQDAYCYLLERPDGGGSGSRMRRTFCRVRTGEPASLERLARLPQETPDSGSIAGGWFHRGYYYFVTYEKHENWLMWWGEGLKPKWRWALNRVRLLK